MVKNIKKFVNDVVSEMQKVAWPTREQLQESTVVVVVVTAIITGFIYLIDLLMGNLITAIF
jgi:preprotein translocase subunit SecE